MAAPMIQSLLWNDGERVMAYPSIHRLMFRYLWDSLNAKRGFGWDTNPWVYVVEFARVK